MKRLSIIIMMLLLQFIPFNGISQRYKNREVTLIQFNINILPEIKKQLDQLENNFPDTKNIKADKIIAKIKEQSWGLLSDKLQQDVGMLIMPINTLGDKITYDAYGFPDVGISKAQKKGGSKYYMKIDLQIGPEMFQYNSTPKTKDYKDSIPQRVILSDDEIKPVITITLTTFSSNGIIPVDKFVGEIIAPKPLKVDVKILDGLINDANSNDKSTIMSLIKETVDDLILSILTD